MMMEKKKSELKAENCVEQMAEDEEKEEEEEKQQQRKSRATGK